MTGVLADQGIIYDKDFMVQPRIENVEARYNSTTPLYYCILFDQEFLNQDQSSINMDVNKLGVYTDKTVKEFFLEKWTNKIKCIQSLEDEYFTEENIEMPNDLAFSYTYQLINELAENNIFPDKMSTSVDEGICIKFKNKGKALYFEIYNTGELGYIIEDLNLHKTIENEDVYSIDEMVIRINDFILN